MTVTAEAVAISRAAARAVNAATPPNAATPIDQDWLVTIQTAVSRARAWSDLPKKVRSWIELHDPGT